MKPLFTFENKSNGYKTAFNFKPDLDSKTQADERRPCCGQISNSETKTLFKTKKGISIDVAAGCNFHCCHCSHFCNYGRKGIIPIDTVIYTMAEWSKRILPPSVCITGGECFLHPQLKKIIEYARQFFPKTVLRIYTNGSMLKRRLPELRKTLLKTKAELVVSIKDYKRVTKKEWTPIVKEGIKEANNAGIPVEIRNYLWVNIQAGKSKDGKALAFHGEQQTGFKFCTTKNCSSFVFQNKIWKCPPAYVAWKMSGEGLLDCGEWADMLSSKPLTTEESDQSLKNFFNRESCICCKNCRQFSKIIAGCNPDFPKGVTKNYLAQK